MVLTAVFNVVPARRAAGEQSWVGGVVQDVCDLSEETGREDLIQARERRANGPLGLLMSSWRATLYLMRVAFTVQHKASEVRDPL